MHRVDFLNCLHCQLTPPGNVWQCKEGHLLCDACSLGCTKCSLCQHAVNSRNRVAETMLDTMWNECPSCQLKVSLRDWTAHENQDCVNAPLKCPFPTGGACCRSFATLAAFEGHIEKVHLTPKHAKTYCCFGKQAAVELTLNVTDKYIMREEDSEVVVFPYGCTNGFDLETGRIKARVERPLSRKPVRFPIVKSG